MNLAGHARRWPLVAPVALLVTTLIPQRIPDVRPTMLPWDAPLREFWRRPAEVEDQNLFDGPWDRANAPDTGAEFRLVSRASDEANPELIVADDTGRQWSVLRRPHPRPGYGSIEVVLSRVLSALGYHQPPVYFVPSFVMRDAAGVRVWSEGRFRRVGGSIRARDTWRWARNPFVGMFPYQGLLVVLLMFNASNLDSTSNAICDVVDGGAAEQRYVVEDLAAALGPRGLAGGEDPDFFARDRFVVAVSNGYAEFAYDGPGRELVHNRITPDDVGWASFLLSRLDERQWHDAFRAGGYDSVVAARFIDALGARIARGREIGGDDWP